MSQPLPDRPPLPRTWADYLRAMNGWRKACAVAAAAPYDWRVDDPPNGRTPHVGTTP